MVLSASCLLWNKGVGSSEVLVDDGAYLKKIIEKAVQSINHASTKASSKTYNFGIYAIFSLVNVSLGLGGQAIIKDR